jgi:hypothetical protein
MGALAGALSVLVFTAIHHLLIIPIWFALPAMLVAGVLCGACLAWSYFLVVRGRTIRTWLQYNALYLGVLVALSLTSLLVFEPVTTIAVLLQRREPPSELVVRALPVTVLFTLATAVLLSALYHPGWRGAGAILVTTSVIVVFLGLNLSVMGLVSVPRSALYLVAELLLLILALGLVYSTAVVALGQSRFYNSSP